MRCTALLLSLLLFSCVSRPLTHSRPRDARALLRWVPDNCEAIFAIDLTALRKHTLGEQIIPLLRETTLYQLFASQLRSDFLQNGNLFAITARDIGTPRAKVMFLLDGEEHHGPPNTQTLYLLPQDIGLYFPTKTMILLGNKDLIEQAFRRSMGQNNSIEQAAETKTLLPRAPSVLFGFVRFSAASQLRFSMLYESLQYAAAFSFALSAENTLSGQLVWPSMRAAQDNEVLLKKKLMEPLLWRSPLHELLAQKLQLSTQENKLLYVFSPSTHWVTGFSRELRDWLKNWLQPPKTRSLPEGARVTLRDRP